jgi:hypothetical protein
MRKIHALILIVIVLFPSYILTTTLPTRASEGKAQVYILCLPDVGGWTFPDRPFDPSRTKTGAIDALLFKEDAYLPKAHPQFGKAPPFYSITYQVVSDWSSYRSIIESDSEVIVINTHGQIIPIPYPYNKTGWVDKIATAMLERRVGWVSTAGYPFYQVWYQGASEWELWGENGFKQLMSHINLPEVTLSYDYELQKEHMDLAAQNTLMDSWPDLSNAFRVQRGRPLKVSDFHNCTILPIWGSEGDFMTGATIAFVKPNERKERQGFGAYVHIGTNGTFMAGNFTTDGDYWRGFAGAAAAVMTETQAFEPTTNVVETYNEYGDYSAWSLSVTPVITYSYCYNTPGGRFCKIMVDFGIYGMLMTNGSDRINQVSFSLSAPSGCKAVMEPWASKDAYITADQKLGIDWWAIGKFGVSTLLLFLAPEPYSKLWLITKILGGTILFSNFRELFPRVAASPREGVNETNPPNNEVLFWYDPTEYETVRDGYYYQEFESVIHIELEVDMADRHQWTILPLDWDILMSNQYKWPFSLCSRSSIALYNDYNESDYRATIFFDDFQHGLSGWSNSDANSLSGHDYWGMYTPIGHLSSPCVWCAQVGNNSVYGEKLNINCTTDPLGFHMRYDKNMDAILSLDLDLRPYRSAWLRYKIIYYICSGDNLTVDYYSGYNWNNLEIYTDGSGMNNTCEFPIPRTATKVRFRFVSNGDDTVNYGAWIYHTELVAELPNDANTNEDAHEPASGATQIATGMYLGYLNYDEDWYNFTVTSSDINNRKVISFDLYSPTNALFLAELYNKYGQRVAGPSIYITYSLSSSDHSGKWSIRIYANRGFGQYKFVLSKTAGGSGCPFLYVWNGSQYIIDNNILPSSELTNGTDVQDYYRLEQPLVPRNGKYSIIIGEFENEHSYLDQAKLLAVDHNSNVNITVTPDGEILTYKNPIAPTYAFDNYGNDRLSEISHIDGNINDPTTHFFGYEGDFLVLNFGRINSSIAKLILRDDMKSSEICINVQIINSTGQWQTVIRLSPRNYWSIEAVDLSPYIIENQDFIVRLLWTSPHRLDYVGLDTTEQEDYDTHTGSLIFAIHSNQGDVRQLLADSDNEYVELFPNQLIWLQFRLPNKTRQTRTYIFYTEGHYYTIP